MNVSNALIKEQEIFSDPLLQTSFCRSFHKDSDGNTSISPWVVPTGKYYTNYYLMLKPITVSSEQGGTYYSEVNRTLNLTESQKIPPRLEYPNNSNQVTSQAFITFLGRYEFIIKFVLMFLITYFLGFLMTRSFWLPLITAALFSVSSVIGSYIRKK